MPGLLDFAPALGAMATGAGLGKTDARNRALQDAHLGLQTGQLEKQNRLADLQIQKEQRLLDAEQEKRTHSEWLQQNAPKIDPNDPDGPSKLNLWLNQPDTFVHMMGSGNPNVVTNYLRTVSQANSANQKLKMQQDVLAEAKRYHGELMSSKNFAGLLAGSKTYQARAAEGRRAAQQARSLAQKAHQYGMERGDQSSLDDEASLLQQADQFDMQAMQDEQTSLQWGNEAQGFMSGQGGSLGGVTPEPKTSGAAPTATEQNPWELLKQQGIKSGTILYDDQGNPTVTPGPALTTQSSPEHVEAQRIHDDFIAQVKPKYPWATDQQLETAYDQWLKSGQKTFQSIPMPSNQLLARRRGGGIPASGAPPILGSGVGTLGTMGAAPRPPGLVVPPPDTTPTRKPAIVTPGGYKAADEQRKSDQKARDRAAALANAKDLKLSPGWVNPNSAKGGGKLTDSDKYKADLAALTPGQQRIVLEAPLGSRPAIAAQAAKIVGSHDRITLEIRKSVHASQRSDAMKKGRAAWEAESKQIAKKDAELRRLEAASSKPKPGKVPTITAAQRDKYLKEWNRSHDVAKAKRAAGMQ